MISRILQIPRYLYISYYNRTDSQHCQPFLFLYWYIHNCPQFSGIHVLEYLKSIPTNISGIYRYKLVRFTIHVSISMLISFIFCTFFQCTHFSSCWYIHFSSFSNECSGWYISYCFCVGVHFNNMSFLSLPGFDIFSLLMFVTLL